MNTTFEEPVCAASSESSVNVSSHTESSSEADKSRDFEYRQVRILPGIVNISGVSNKQISVEANHERIIVMINPHLQREGANDTCVNNSQCIKISFSPANMNQGLSSSIPKLESDSGSTRYYYAHDSCYRGIQQIHPLGSPTSSVSSRECVSSIDSQSIELGADFQCRIFNDTLIECLVNSVGEGKKVSEVIYNQFIQYDYRRPPLWFTKKYSHYKNTMNRCARYILKKCSQGLGWYPNKKQSGRCFPVFTNTNISDTDLRLHPKFIHFVLNNFEAYELIANPLVIKSLLLNLCINSAFMGHQDKDRDLEITDLYEALSFKEIEHGKRTDNNSFLALCTGNEEYYRNNCYPGLLYFIKKFCWLLNQTQLSERNSNQLDKHQIVTNFEDGTLKVKTTYCSELLMDCVTFMLAFRLLEKEILVPGIIKLSAKEKEDTSYSFITETDQGVIKNLLMLIDCLENEANKMIKQRQSAISQFPREISGRFFEERVMGLKKNNNDFYLIKAFIPIKEKLNKILKLGNTSSSAEQANFSSISADNGCS